MGTSQLTAKSVISPNQSGSRAGDSFLSQLLSIRHEIYQLFNNNFGGLFLEILEAFNKMWHDSLIFKLHQYVKSKNLLKLLKGFLKNLKKRVSLNGQSSS